jgi:hypothetical protein
VDDTPEELKDTNSYTHLDLASRFRQVRLREEDEHKSTFETPHGLMTWVAMPFGLCNAIATFQRIMNDILRDSHRGYRDTPPSIEIEIVYNMYRMRRFFTKKPYAPGAVSGPS